MFFRSIFILLLFSLTLFAQYGRIEYSPHSDTIPLSNISTGGIDSVFSYVYSHGWLVDFEDCNICKSRAHIISRMIEKQYPEINIAKVWLIADCKRNSQKNKYRYKPNVYLHYPGKCVNWAYHVAPVIITALDTFVIDPATQIKPVSLKVWAENIIPGNGKAFVIIKDDRFYIYPQTENDLFEDDLAKWNEKSLKLTDDKYLRSIDETLQAKHGFYEPWKFNYYMSELIKLLE